MRPLLGLLFLFSFLTSCESQKDTTEFSMDFMMDVVFDSTYIAYQQTIHTDEWNIALGKYDLKAIGEVFDELPYGENICSSAHAIKRFQEIRGGGIYLSNECKRQELIQKLDEKFNFTDLPEEVGLMMVQMYRELHRIELEEMYLELQNKRN